MALGLGAVSNWVGTAAQVWKATVQKVEAKSIGSWDTPAFLFMLNLKRTSHGEGGAVTALLGPVCS